MRKVIQLSTHESFLEVLCDDGTLWHFSNDKWSRMKDIPQDLAETEQEKDNHDREVFYNGFISGISVVPDWHPELTRIKSDERYIKWKETGK